MLAKVAGTTTGELTLTTILAVLRSRFVCCAGAQHVQQSDWHGLLIEVVFLGLKPE